jgi:uncharacterized protein (TIGR00645 family)
MKKFEKLFEEIIFGSRWIQAPVYFGLIIGSVLYSYKFLLELIHLCTTINELTEEHLMLGVLTLVDITMVLNLLIMVIVGGYATFVSHINLDEHEDRPDWLEKIDAGMLKVKLAGSLVSVSGIHLLKAFVDIDAKDLQHVMWQVIIHFVFLISTLILAYTEKITHSRHEEKQHG